MYNEVLIRETYRRIVQNNPHLYLRKLHIKTINYISIYLTNTSSGDISLISLQNYHHGSEISDPFLLIYSIPPSRVSF